MANANTIAGIPTCLASGNVLAETAFGLAPANTVRGVLAMPPWVSNSSLDGHEIQLRAGILATTAGSFTYGPSIRLNSGGNTNLTTFTSDNYPCRSDARYGNAPADDHRSPELGSCNGAA